MDVVGKERLKLIESISSTIGDSVARVNDLVQKLGWDRENNKKEGRNLVKCPHNEDHNVRSDRMEEHIKHCKLTSAGFTNVARKDIPDISSFFYETPSSSVTQISIGKEQLDQLGLCFRKHTDKATEEVDSVDAAVNLPAYYLDTMLNVEERLKLYEYVVQAGKSIQKGPTMSFDELEKEAEEQLKVLEMQDQDERPKDKIEALAELRDYKRRRQTYRGKNPIYNRRPATDVIRELIDQQMKYLEILTGKKINDNASEENAEAASLNENNTIAVGNSAREDPDDSRSSDKRSHRDSERGEGFSGRDQRVDRSNRRERERDRNREGRGRQNRETDERYRRDRSRDRYRRHDNARNDRMTDRSRDRDRERGRERGTEWDRDTQRDRRDRDRERDRSREKQARGDSEDRYQSGKEDIRGARSSNTYQKEEREFSGDFDIVKSLREIRESAGHDDEKGSSIDVVEAVEVKGSSSQSDIGNERVGGFRTERELIAEESKVLQTSSLQNDEGFVQRREHLKERDLDEKKVKRKRRSSESRSRSRSRSRERRHKHKKDKHKHKKKKYRSREESEESDRYEDDSDEWVEKN